MLSRLAAVGIPLVMTCTVGGCGDWLGGCPDLHCTGPHTFEVCDDGKVTESSCGEARCVDTLTRPICAVSTTPVHECVTPVHTLGDHANTVCFDGAKTRCLEGYPYDAVPCLIEPCIDTAACGAVCVDHPVADHPACTEPGVRSLCIEDVAVTCGCGRAPVEQRCPVACAAAPPDLDPGEGFCALDASPDPRCPDYRGGGAERSNAFCDGSARVQCYHGFPIERQACASCDVTAYGDVVCHD